MGGFMSASCSKCGSTDLICTCEIFEGNAERGGIEWQHYCKGCGNVDDFFLVGTYGFECEHVCPVEGCGKVHYG